MRFWKLTAVIVLTDMLAIPALDGIATPLHPGAERFYREVGMVAGEK